MFTHAQLRSCSMGDSTAIAKDGWTDLRCRDDVCLSPVFLSLTDMGSISKLCVRIARVELRSVQGGILVEELMKVG